jgi:cardiolipin synthase
MLAAAGDIALRLWPYVAGGFVLGCAVVAAGHAAMYKRDARAAAGWVGLILVFPLAGSLLYYFLGINRIQRTAVRLRRRQPLTRKACELVCTPQELREMLPAGARHLASLNMAVARITSAPLLEGNAIEPLVNGDAAYPAMIAAIDNARASVAMLTYIFDNDAAGRMFVDALARAVQRGVAVRVLIDAIGARYSRPSIIKTLRAARVPVQRFMPSSKPWRTQYMNLRNHRKMLVLDGCVAFTGGMNIRIGHMMQQPSRHPVQDLHFRVQGPVVSQLREVFAEDWLFSSGETLQGARWFPNVATAGTVIARGITDGPDENLNKLERVLQSALASAQRSIKILTPYFLPSMALIAALNTAALRGVAVDIILPARNNLRTVGWAMMAQLWQVLEWGCRVWLTPPPFDHSKLMLVDGEWSLLGSANWDPRSLRLNFEYNIECYSRALATTLDALLEAKRAAARPITLADVDGRRLLLRLRDSVARLFAPYL